jgi:hypothetical protein
LGDAQVAPRVTTRASSEQKEGESQHRSAPWSQTTATTKGRPFTSFLPRGLYDGRVRRPLLLLALLASLVFAGEARAGEVILNDNEGRSIRFNMKVEGVDAEWYAALLRAAPHGNEISTVRVDVVSWDELHTTCGPDAAGCYSRSVMVVPAEQSDEIAHTVVHEYGHHLDRSTPVTDIREPNGTPTWWRARSMERLVRVGSVATSYVLGWERSIAEIFAEDYAQLVLGDSHFAIPWLHPPDATILAALKFDLGLGPEPEIAALPALKPVSISRHGTLVPKLGVGIPFRLLGLGRRVVATATFSGAKETRPRAKLELRCDGNRIVLRTIGTGKTTISIDQLNLGPADCRVTLVSTSTSKRTYSLVVRLTIPGA